MGAFMEIIDSVWFMDVGIVLAKDKITGENKAYIGKAIGISKRDDEEYILKHGMPIYLLMLKRIMSHLQMNINQKERENIIQSVNDVLQDYQAKEEKKGKTAVPFAEFKELIINLVHHVI